MVRHTSLFLILTLSALLLSSCGKTAQKAETLNITTSFYPIYIFTLNITQGVPGIRVANLTKPTTGCLHDYALAPADMKTLESTDIFIVNGGGMESWMEKVTGTIPSDHIIDSSLGIEPIVSAGAVNPHYFVSVSEAIKQVNNIGKRLAELDTVHKEQYQANTAAYIARLTTLKAQMHAGLDRLPDKFIITFHEAFPYFAREFGFKIAAVIEREPGSEPSARELADTIEIIKNQKVRAIYVEPQYSAQAAQTIVAETDAKIYLIVPFVTGSYELDAYEQAMLQNLRTIQRIVD